MRIFIFLKLMLLKTDQGKTVVAVESFSRYFMLWVPFVVKHMKDFDADFWMQIYQEFATTYPEMDTTHSCMQAVSNEIPILVNISFNANYLQISKFQYFMKHWSLNVTSGCDARAHKAQIWAKGGGAGLGSHHNLHGTLTLVSSPCFHLYPLV